MAEERLALLPGGARARGRADATRSRELAREAGAGRRSSSSASAAPWACPVPDPRRAGLRRGRPGGGPRAAAAFADAGFPEEASMEVLRVVGASMARVAEAMRGADRRGAGPAGRHRARSRAAPRRVRRASPRRTGASCSPTCSSSTCSSRCAATSSRGPRLRRASVIPGAQEVGVAFADLVGFTRLGERRPVGRAGRGGRAAGRDGRRRWPSRRCAWSRRSATPRCSCRPSPAPLLDATLGLVDGRRGGGRRVPAAARGRGAGPAPCRAAATGTATRSTWPAG